MKMTLQTSFLFFIVFALCSSFKVDNYKSFKACNAGLKTINNSNIDVIQVRIAGTDFNSNTISFSSFATVGASSSNVVDINTTSGNIATGIYVANGMLRTAQPDAGTLKIYDIDMTTLLATFNFTTPTLLHGFSYSSSYLCFGVAYVWK